ncbi:MAG: D-glycerate dehydrogenase [Candidatus Scalindua rubra]|uniref:D-isomer specific 2-hydroxyacid dehydrogenase NAD-binding protein n=1 Tax=Candidatus Scalindua brodae TaxID=237368 RepID=A0A0B0ENY7_9BACT|nr:MAG: D-isomer specific 2-hydroxyacid dehydrogenase NAD-binding protein [Candidatus Scalindua brodae]MBZ0109258.1 D-glycerate dehydrogenase [Candidatus Scalindua rubra]TWU36823.1 putative 2-hydroxyacid dehydrogenase [Candidatus Brocadiaceae bacterium S225]
MTGSVYITRGIPEEGIARLKECCGTVEINPDDRPLTYDELVEQVKGRDAILTMLSDRIDVQLLKEAKNLKVIANYAVGFDNIDIGAATSHGIVVANTPGVLTEATADMAWALLFAIARRIVEGDRVTRKGEFTGWSPLFLLGGDLVGKTLGIIGSGRIGTAMALRSRGWCMKVLYTSQKKNNAVLEEELNAKRVALETLLKESDFISLHTPFTEKTRHLIGKDEFAIMKRTAYLINTARGAVIDEAAMVDALRSNRIAGAGLDVYEEEPKLKPGLEALDNVVLAPHLGSATVETRGRMSIMAAESIIAVLKGQKPENCLNPEVILKQ